ncbi:ribulose-phosphate 3-epimerase [Neobacillus niacini]|uniref:ribulose-phosphate 3-epimerase n=1 Tax=Neobacillus niacini TaxID=86668 RepID=UPI0005EDD6CA|nr:pentose-5-phosphate 3-epimerase [Neobacillus niacini]
MKKYIKIAAGLAHVDYGHLADIVKEASEAGADYIHSDAADMYDLRNMQLMGGHQVIEGIRPVTDKPIECHIYTRECDRLFIEKIAAAGANMLIIPVEHFIGAPLAYIINYCREFGIKIGLTIGCYTPLSFVEEAIYDIDRLHIVVHGVDETDGKDNWGWRRSSLDLVKRARKLINEKNPKCELAVDGGLRAENLAPMIEAEPDVVILSSGIFKYEEGITAGVKACRAAIDAASIEYFGE